MRCYCPFHPNPNGKTLWISPDPGRWGCFSMRCAKRSGGDLATLLMLRGMPREAAQTVVRNMDLKKYVAPEGPVNQADLDRLGVVSEGHLQFWRVDWHTVSDVCARALKTGGVGYVQGQPLLDWIPDVPVERGDVEHDCWEWLQYAVLKRGMPAVGLDLLDVGFDRDHGLLTFPIRGPKGELRGVARRECQDKKDYIISGCVWMPTEVGYNYIRVERGDTFWGWYDFKTRIDAGSPIIVVEGYLDAVQLAGMGYVAVAKSGRKMTKAQVDLLLSAPGPKILWPDCDRPGIDGMIDDAKALLFASGVAIVSWFGGVKDAGTAGLSANTVSKVIASAKKPFEWLGLGPNLLAQATNIR